MKSLLQLRRARASRRELDSVIPGPQTSTTDTSRPSSGRSPVTPERVAEIRHRIAAGDYLREDAEAQLNAVVDGLLHDMLTGIRQSRPGCRAAG